MDLSIVVDLLAIGVLALVLTANGMVNHWQSCWVHATNDRARLVAEEKMEKWTSVRGRAGLALVLVMLIGYLILAILSAH